MKTVFIISLYILAWGMVAFVLAALVGIVFSINVKDAYMTISAVMIINFLAMIVSYLSTRRDKQ